MGEVSPVLGSLMILKDSFKLIFKNVKFMAAITILSLLLPSTLLLAFCYIYQTLTNCIHKTLDHDSSSSSNLPPIAYLYISLLLLFEIIFIIAYVKISKISGIATVIVSATDTMISSQHLYSKVKAATERSKLFGYRSSSSRGKTILATFVWVLVICMTILYPNHITITVTVVVGISVFGFVLYAAVPTLLSYVVSVVEEKYEGSEAVERAEELVQGQRQHGFMVNLFINLPFLIIFLGFWLVLGGSRLLSVEFGLILVNSVGLGRICVCVANTVFYFRCKNYHDEGVGVVENFGYSELDGGIP